MPFVTHICIVSPCDLIVGKPFLAIEELNAALGVAQLLCDPNLHSSMVWMIATLHSSIGSSVSAQHSVETATQLSRRCCSVSEIVEGKFASISVAVSISSCDLAVLRVTLHEILDLVSRKHIIKSGSSSFTGYSFFEQYIFALLMQGNIELLESPDSIVLQHELALQVFFPQHSFAVKSSCLAGGTRGSCACSGCSRILLLARGLYPN